MCNQVVHIQVKYFVWRMNCLCVKHIVMRTEKKRVIINGIKIRRTSDIEIESTKLVNLNSTSSVLSFFNYYLHIFNCFNYSIDLDSTAHMLCFYCYWHRCSSRNIVAVDLFQSTQTIFEVKVCRIESNLFESCYIKNRNEQVSHNWFLYSVIQIWKICSRFFFFFLQNIVYSIWCEILIFVLVLICFKSDQSITSSFK
jgi:hypothetical protein